METFVIYSNVILTFALGALAAAALARATLARAAVDGIRRDMPTDARVQERAIKAVHESIHSTLERIVIMPDFRRCVAQLVQTEVARGTLAALVKQSIEDHCRQLGRYLEQEALPRAVAAALEVRDDALAAADRTEVVVA